MSRGVRLLTSQHAWQQVFGAIRNHEGGRGRVTSMTSRKWSCVGIRRLMICSAACLAAMACGGRGSAPKLAGISIAHGVNANGMTLSHDRVRALLNPKGLPAYSGPTGSIEGTVTILGDAPPDVPGLDFGNCPAGKETYGKAFRVGAPSANGALALADALVVVAGSSVYVPERSTQKTVTLDACALNARTIDLTLGQSLAVVNNSDAPLLPALDPSPRLVTSLATKGGGPISLLLDDVRPYTLVDRASRHYLKADVFPFTHPFHAVTGLDGRYRITGVPVGHFRVYARLPTTHGEATREVDVSPNTVTAIDLQLTYHVPAAVPLLPAPPTYPTNSPAGHRLGGQPAPQTALTPSARKARWLKGPVVGHDNSIASLRPVSITGVGPYKLTIPNQFNFSCNLEFGASGRPFRLSGCHSPESNHPRFKRWIIELHCLDRVATEECSGSTGGVATDPGADDFGFDGILLVRRSEKL